MNNNNSRSFYDSVHDFCKGQTLAAWVFWLSVVLLLIGANNFWEDTYSSYIGVQEIEKTFQVKAVSWWLTYLGMSLSFQIITVLAGVTYMSDTKKYWYAGWIALGAQGIDFIADVWYRANGVWNGWASVSVSFVLTFIFFTIGSEFAITVGLGLVARMFVEGMAQTGILVRNIIAGIGKLAQILASGSAEGKGATHSNVTHGFQDVRHQGGNQNQGKPQNGGNGNGQGKPVFNNPNQKPQFKPNTGGGGDNKPNDNVSELDAEKLRQLFGKAPGDYKGGNPFQGGGGKP